MQDDARRRALDEVGQALGRAAAEEEDQQEGQHPTVYTIARRAVPGVDLVGSRGRVAGRL